MSDIPSAHTKVEKFKGRSGRECEEFIQAVRRVAWAEGKMQDNTWMANFASLHFSGRAFKWHSTLPQNVRQDWAKLEQALIDRWPPPDSDSDEEERQAQVVPTPAAAPAQPMGRAGSSELGMLEFVFSDDGPVRSQYIREDPGDNGACGLTTDISKAMKVRLGGSFDSGIRIIECLRGSSYQWLAIAWTTASPKFTKVSKEWGRITLADPPTLKVPGLLLLNKGLNLLRIAAWRIDSERNVAGVWKSQDDGSFELTISTMEDHLYVTTDILSFPPHNVRGRKGCLKYRPST